MQTVSFETAKALKEAGFPQPKKYERGQVGYYQLAGEFSDGFVLLSPVESMFSSDDVGEFIAFAPIATDLIPPGWVLVNYIDHWVAISAGSLINSIGKNYEEPYFAHDNPAEAAATAWLFMNQKNDRK